MANEIPTMSLKVGNIQMPTFTGLQYKATPEDLSILQNSLQRLDANKVAAAQERNKVDVAMGDLETKLNEADLPWFNDYKRNIDNQIAEQAEVGNYVGAARTAISLAGDVAKDSAILNRIKNNADYNETLKHQQDRLDKGEINKSTFDWWKANNPYSFNPIYDNSNKEIGYNKTDYNTPLKDINWDQEILTSFKLISPETYSNTTSWGSDTNKVTKDNPDARRIGNEGNKTNAYEKVDRQQIIDNMYQRITSNPDMLNQVKQQVQVRLWKLKQLKDNLNPLDSDYESNLNYINKEEKLLYKNGHALNINNIDYYNYIKQMVDDSALTENLAYNNKKIVSGSTTHDIGDTSSNSSKKSYNGPLGDNYKGHNTPKGKGYNVNWKTPTLPNDATINTDATTERFEQ